MEHHACPYIDKDEDQVPTPQEIENVAHYRIFIDHYRSVPLKDKPEGLCNTNNLTESFFTHTLMLMLADQVLQHYAFAWHTCGRSKLPPTPGVRDLWERHERGLVLGATNKETVLQGTLHRFCGRKYSQGLADLSSQLLLLCQTLLLPMTRSLMLASVGASDRVMGKVKEGIGRTASNQGM
ncbi:hypothetical protein QOT17_014701 [Balamuthia mandrillaris]